MLARRQLRDRRRFPVISFNSGTRSTISLAFGPSASRRASRQAANSASLSPAGADQALKGLCQRRIGDVALVLVELAGGEEPPHWHQRLVQLIDDGGLADAGISRDQHQLRPAALDDAIEGGEQGSTSRSRPYSFSGISSRSDKSARQAGTTRCGHVLPIRTGTAVDRAQCQRRSGSAPPWS